MGTRSWLTCRVVMAQAVQSTHLQFVPKRVSSGFLTEHSFAIRVKESLKSLYKETAKVY